MGTAVSETAMAADGPRGTGSGAAAGLERREILRALRLLRRGDFSVRLPLDLTGVDGEIACAFNEVVELNDAMTRDFERVSEMVGREGTCTARPARGRSAWIRSTAWSATCRTRSRKWRA